MARLDWQAVVAGVGGQGVLFVTRVLAQAALRRGGRVIISEVHGMAQRGGPVVSHLKAGAHAGPLVNLGRAGLLFALDPGEAVRNLAFLAPGGELVVNAPDEGWLSPQGRRELKRQGIRLTLCDATAAAGAAGNLRGANVVLMAAAAAAGALPFDAAELRGVLMDMTPPARRESNRRLFAAGAG